MIWLILQIAVLAQVPVDSGISDDPGSVANQSPTVVDDAIGEVVLRRTDYGATGDVAEPLHAKPDIAGYEIGNWQPTDPATDLYAGVWDSEGLFFRFDITFAGLVNPPGKLGIDLDECFPNCLYDPYLYGPNPIFGIVEFDVDASVETGGETDIPGSRYLGNIARFGGKPSLSRFADRVALSEDDLDGWFTSPPYVERSGEEYHLDFTSDLINEVIEVSGDGDGMFEAGDIWLVRGKLLHRAPAFAPFSNAGAQGEGYYQPVVDVRFEYLPQSVSTRVSLVYPLTNIGSAQQNGQPVEPIDRYFENQNSIHEGLYELRSSLELIPAGDPIRSRDDFPIIALWEFQDPGDYLDSRQWNVNVLVGMAYVNQIWPGAPLLAWTDTMPDSRFADFTGDGHVNGRDFDEIAAFIADHDGVIGWDADETQDGGVELMGFGPNFSVFDLNYDGYVNDADFDYIVVTGDLDGDWDLDAQDLAIFVQLLLDRSGAVPTILERADINGDGSVNGVDIRGFLEAMLAE